MCRRYTVELQARLAADAVAVAAQQVASMARNVAEEERQLAEEAAEKASRAATLCNSLNEATIRAASKQQKQNTVCLECQQRNETANMSRSGEVQASSSFLPIQLVEKVQSPVLAAHELLSQCGKMAVDHAADVANELVQKDVERLLSGSRQIEDSRAEFEEQQLAVRC